MRDSASYQALVEEGQVMQARADIRRIAEKRFGRADKAMLDQLACTTDLDHLDRIYDRILEAKDWQDLLGTP